ncbi:hypothetical protein K1719_045719 [Acacia pycnantha]|nr:hypothetical protein K1719_045719 [Acacia pycnantha]
MRDSCGLRGVARLSRPQAQSLQELEDCIRGTVSFNCPEVRRGLMFCVISDYSVIVHTMHGARNEIFVMQPAPIQVSYMGFPITTGLLILTTWSSMRLDHLHD